jgi:hypothetical protein
MKRAVIICSPDGYANAIKPAKLKEFFVEHGYNVIVYPTNHLSRLGERGYQAMLPGLTLSQFRLYCCEAVQLAVNRRKLSFLRKLGVSLTTKRMIGLRGKILHKRLKSGSYDIMICESNLDESLIAYRISKIQILDLPAPFAEELFYGGQLTKHRYDLLKTYEENLYRRADYLSFHWYMYAEFVRKNKYEGNNIIDIGYSAPLRERRAQHADEPRIVFLGFLGGYWVNLPLLEELSDLYPIDVYGGPKPAGYKVNYRGYAPSIDVLADYQFGLITITKDLLRQSSFSSKQLDYYAFGLPVLTPEWRTDTVLDPGAIHFSADNFVKLIKEYSDRDRWQEKSDAAISIAKERTWESAFRPLTEIVERQLRADAIRGVWL